MTRPRLIAAALAALALLACAGLALAADRTDRSFGRDGTAQPPPPSGTAGIGLGIRDLANAKGGRLVAAIGDLEGRGYFAAARLSPKGSLDTSFGSGGYTTRFHIRHHDRAGAGLQLRARAVAVQSNGRILVAGYQENEFKGMAPLLVRFRPGGAVDSSFGNGGKVAPVPASEGSDPIHLRGGGLLRDVAVESSGRIVAVGGRNEFGGGQPAGLVLAYRSDGSIDRSFGSEGRVVLSRPRDHLFTGFTSIEPLRSGKILVAGYLRGRLALVRLTQTGQLDPAFGGGDGIVMPSAGQPRSCCPAQAVIALAKGGGILLGGIAERAREEPLLLFRLRQDGQLDPSFGSGGKVVGRPHRADLSGFLEFGMARQRNGRIVIAGAAERVDRERTISYRFTAIRYLANGKVDRGFGSRGVHTLQPATGGAAVTVLALSEGRVVVGGGLYDLHARPNLFRPTLTRYLANG